MKDLAFESLAVDDRGVTVTIRFAPNEFKHDLGLTLVYSGTTEVAVSLPREPHVVRQGNVTLDELLPAEGGFTHEIGLTGDSVIRIVAGDLDARWE